MSDPSSIGVNPIESAAAEPPDDPPAVRVTSCGLLVVPYTSLKLWMSPAKIGRLVLANGIAPAARSRATGAASSVGHERRQLRRARRRDAALGLERVLDRHRHAVQRAELVAVVHGVVGGACRLARAVEIPHHDRVDRPVEPLDARRRSARAPRRPTPRDRGWRRRDRPRSTSAGPTSPHHAYHLEQRSVPLPRWGCSDGSWSV